MLTLALGCQCGALRHVRDHLGVHSVQVAARAGHGQLGLAQPGRQAVLFQRVMPDLPADALDALAQARQIGGGLAGAGRHGQRQHHDRQQRHGQLQPYLQNSGSGPRHAEKSNSKAIMRAPQ